MRNLAYVLIACVGVGCGGNNSSPWTNDTDAVASQDASNADVDGQVRSDGSGGRPDYGTPPDVNTANQDMTIVYAHSASTLFAIDPRSNAFSTLGNFAFPSDGMHHSMTDIAVDATGGVVGVTSDALYRIDANTAACTLLSPLPGMHTFVGLTYVPVGVLDPNIEVLVGGATDGTYWRIDMTTGVATQVGQFNNNWGLSGDIVSIANAATYATLRKTNASSSSTDTLATIDPTTGMVHVIGDTGVAHIFGLGYWRSTLFGFTRDGQFVTIDVQTGLAHPVSMPTSSFAGAGVTTLAPVIPG